MASAQLAAHTYAAAFEEPDADKRATMFEACWAEDGRLVSPSGGLRGRAAIIRSADDFFADPNNVRSRIVGSIDVRGRTFRYIAALDRADGTTVEFYDYGEVDDDGRIRTIITFTGPMP